MTIRERVEAVLQHETPDRVPFIPFDELIPRAAFELDWRNGGMGTLHHYSSVVETNDTPYTVRWEGNESFYTYETPFGPMTECFQHKHGVSNTGRVRTKFKIETKEDYAKAIWHINQMQYHLDESGDDKEDFYVGDGGYTHVWAGEPPYMEAQYYLGLENWAYHQLDYEEEFAQLMDALEAMQERRMACVAKARQTMVNIGNLAGNFSPAAFETQVVPYFKKFTDLLHANGKLVTVHADASNLREYAHLIPACGVDIVEAFTPPPVGNLSLRDARAAWGEDITILINFPETIFYNPEGYEGVKRYTKELLESDPCPNKIMSVTEMGFAGATNENMHIIADGFRAVLDAVNEYGNY